MTKFRGKIIAVSGIDGCGKTTLIEGLKHGLDAYGIPNRYIWLRYNHYLAKPLLGFCRLIGLTRYETIEKIRVGYHNFHRSGIISRGFILLTLVDTLCASFFLVYVPAYLSRTTIICDRWILDIVIDLEIDTQIKLDRTSWIGRLFHRLIPDQSHYFLITRDKGALLSARAENRFDRNFARRFELYQNHAQVGGFRVIENNGTIEDAVSEMLSQSLPSDRTNNDGNNSGES